MEGNSRDFALLSHKDGGNSRDFALLSHEDYPPDPPDPPHPVVLKKNFQVRGAQKGAIAIKILVDLPEELTQWSLLHISILPKPIMNP